MNEKLAARKLPAKGKVASEPGEDEADLLEKMPTKRTPSDPPKRRPALYISLGLFVLWTCFLIYVAYQVLYGGS